ncbi:MAG: glycosyltransferase, partial [Chloroflexota bacterium]|nr:glycosyltransferase [Chloroflexota bacterium]
MTLSVVQVIGNVAVGGAERHVLDLVDGLRQRSVSMRVICPRPGPLVESLTQRGVAVHYLEMVRSRPGDEYGLDRGAVEQLIAWFREWRPDVVHSHLYPAHLHASLASVQVG